MLEFVLPGVSNQLHLLGRPGPSGESPTNQGATDIWRVYQQFRFRQVHPNYFLGYFVQLALWIPAMSVENHTLRNPRFVVPGMCKDILTDLLTISGLARLKPSSG